MALKRKDVPFDKIDWKSEVMSELKDREIYSLFLIHGYIEAFLRDWLLIIGGTKAKINKKQFDEMSRISFKNILLTHLALGSFDSILYNKIDALNKFRNDIAHDLHKIDHKAPKNTDKIRKQVLQGIKDCEEIQKLYVGAVYKEGKKIEREETAKT